MRGIWDNLFFKRLAGGVPSNPGGRLSSEDAPPPPAEEEYNDDDGHDAFAWR